MRAIFLAPALGLCLSACPPSTQDPDDLPDAASSGGDAAKGPGAGPATRDAAATSPSKDAAAPGQPDDAATDGHSGDAAASGDSGATACDLDCPADQHCELVAVVCITTPCPPLPQCVSDDAGTAPGPVDCDPRKIRCKRAVPTCPDFHVPSVVDGCYGDCVPLDDCPCDEAADCPAPDIGTCHMKAGRCGPYV